MKDAVQTLLGEVEREVATLPGAAFFPAGAGGDASRRFTALSGAPPPPGLGAFLAAHDGGFLARDVRVLTLDEAAQRRAAPTRPAGPEGGWPPGLWPVLERNGRRFALDAAGATSDGEWPVVEVSDRGVDRVGTSFLRFLHVLCAELAGGGAVGTGASVTAGASSAAVLAATSAGSGAPEPPTAAELALAEERSRRDPGHADNWLDLAELLEKAGRIGEIEATLTAALRAAAPPTPALLLAIGMRAAQSRDWEAALRAFSDASALEPIGARDDDARLDAAALVYVLAGERGDTAAMAEARRVLGAATAATVAFWRGEALEAAASETPSSTGDLAVRIVEALEPQDPDVAKLRAPAPVLRAALARLQRSRQDLDGGRADAAAREARAALAVPELAAIGAAHAVLAEALNAVRDRGAVEAARRATELNPYLIDGWRELGDAELEAGDHKAAEAAFRRVIEMDGTYGLGHAKLAQVLLEAGRTLEALEAISEAANRGGDPFFIAAIRGDIYAEMERHNDAAEAYDRALEIEPDDHWALHQAALEHGFAGHGARASELFEAALKHDRDGCHQTLVDYGDHLRRQGRIGDAVRLYRKAVAAVPTDPEWKQTLREAERELLAAPN